MQKILLYLAIYTITSCLNYHANVMDSLFTLICYISDSFTLHMFPHPFYLALFMWIGHLNLYVEKMCILSPDLHFTCFHINSMCITQIDIDIDLLSKISQENDVNFFISFTLHVFPHLYHMDYESFYSQRFVVYYHTRILHDFFNQFYPLHFSTSIPHGLHNLLFTLICRLKFPLEKTSVFSSVILFTYFHIYSTWIAWVAIHVDLLSEISHGKAMDIFISFTFHEFSHLFC